MNSKRQRASARPGKSPTGIAGLDAITRGGLPRGRTTLLVGGPGSGKTVMGLEFLVHGARDFRENGVFVAFEEASSRIMANSETFGWKLGTVLRQKVSFMDAQPTPDLIQSGDFDISGMLAALEVQLRKSRATRIVFDALDIILAFLPDPAARRREVLRLHEWLMDHGLTAIITAKADDDETSSIHQRPFRDLLFMVDCAVLLTQRVSGGVSLRTLRVQKYRGSCFDEDESPFAIGALGLEVAGGRGESRPLAKVTNQRVSSGVARLDSMLGGGYFRGASVLVTGFSGTGKTTLSGIFAEAACRRGERTLFVSFDSGSAEVVRNLSSVNIRLARYISKGLLKISPARAIAGSADTYLGRIKALAVEHEARCIVIDPVSNWSKATDEQVAHNVAERLIDWSKSEGTTVVFTRLLDEKFSQTEGASALQVSTLADTWIHLSYVVQGGERNRTLSIIKSRGTAHSNQVRELLFSSAGVTLADTYTASGEVLMGTLRWQRENAERVAGETAKLADELHQIRLGTEEAELEARLSSLQEALIAKRAEQSLALSSSASRTAQVSSRSARTLELRGADAPRPATATRP